MLVKQSFIKENNNSKNNSILVVTYTAGKIGHNTYKKTYSVCEEFFTDELLAELHGDPTYYGPTGKICGIEIWLDGDSFLNFFITKNLRKKLDLMLEQSNK